MWILGRLARAIQEVVAQIKEAAVSSGLVINQRTTKYMNINRNVTNLHEDLIKNGEVFEGVQNFRYLGALINLKKCNK